MLIIGAHKFLEKYTLSKWQQYWKDQVANWYGMFAVHGLRVIETEKGRFVNMPSTSYTDKDGNYINEPEDHDNHGMDAARYYVLYLL